MEVNRLLKDELAYELYIRGLPRNPSASVNDLRKSLREILIKEKETPDNLIRGHIDLVVEDEIRICKAKCSELEQAIENFDPENSKNEYKRIGTRLQHLASRIDRIPVSYEEEEEEQCKLADHCKSVQEELIQIYESAVSSVPHTNPPPLVDHTENDIGDSNSGNLTILDQPNLELISPQRVIPPCTSANPTHGEVWEFPPFSDPIATNSRSQIRSNSLPVASNSIRQKSIPNPTARVNFMPPITEPTTIPNVSSRRATIDSTSPLWNAPEYMSSAMSNLHIPSRRPMYDGWSQETRLPDVSRWNVKFNGRTSVNEFLERVEEFRISRGVSHQQLLRCSPELLTQDALLWYRTRKFVSWQDLCQQLKEAYLPYDYELGLMDEIRKRTQGANEKILNYITIMENLFRKLKQPPIEKDRVILIRRNLLPSIQSQLILHQVSTIDELIVLGRKVEEAQAVMDKYVPPPTSYRSLLEPELAYRKPGNQQPITVASSRPVQSTPVTNRNTSQPPRDNPSIPKSDLEPSCWNCGGTGHRFKKCDQPRRNRFCFKCGSPDVSINNCPRCRKNSSRSQQ